MRRETVDDPFAPEADPYFVASEAPRVGRVEEEQRIGCGEAQADCRIDQTEECEMRRLRQKVVEARGQGVADV